VPRQDGRHGGFVEERRRLSIHHITSFGARSGNLSTKATVDVTRIISGRASEVCSRGVFADVGRRERIHGHCGIFGGDVRSPPES
jgi:hypothetical protein